jgi:hypothetical protein
MSRGVADATFGPKARTSPGRGRAEPPSKRRRCAGVGRWHDSAIRRGFDDRPAFALRLWHELTGDRADSFQTPRPRAPSWGSRAATPCDASRRTRAAPTKSLRPRRGVPSTSCSEVRCGRPRYPGSRTLLRVGTPARCAPRPTPTASSCAERVKPLGAAQARRAVPSSDPCESASSTGGLHPPRPGVTSVPSARTSRPNPQMFDGLPRGLAGRRLCRSSDATGQGAVANNGEDDG